MIELREINHSNWIKCIELELTDDQRHYINPNIFSLAEAYVHSDANIEGAEEYYRCIPFSIYNGDEMIGFAMITYEKECDFDDKPGYEIYRLMIDRNHQGKGYGKEAINLLLNYIRTFPYGEAESVYVEWHPDNKASEKIFVANGFVFVGIDKDGAVMAKLNLNSWIKFDDTLEMLFDIELNNIDKDITVKQFLSHISGILGYFDKSIMDELWRVMDRLF